MTKSPNIWWINQYAALSNEPGGGRHVQLAKSLKKLGCETTIITSTHNYMTRKKYLHQPGCEDNSCNLIQLSTGWSCPGVIGKYLRMVSFGNKVNKAKWTRPFRKPSVIIGSSPSLHAAMGGLKLAKRIGVPFILEIRDFWPASLIEVAGVSPSNPIVKRLTKMEEILVRESDKIISLLPKAAEYYAQLGMSKDKFKWVPNGIDLQLFNDDHNKTRDEVRTIMYSGAHGQANGLFTLIEAAGLLQDTNPDLRFRFIGDGVLKKQLQKFTNKRGIKTVTFDKAVTQDKMPPLLQEADIFVAQLQDLALFKFGVSPNKIYEYMAAAKPIVFGTTSNENPVTSAGMGPVVEPENPKAVADRIREIVGMTVEERELLGKKGWDFVQKYNTFDVLAARVLTCVRKAMDP